jgi:hypothetical protein
VPKLKWLRLPLEAVSVAIESTTITAVIPLKNKQMMITVAVDESAAAEVTVEGNE